MLDIILRGRRQWPRRGNMGHHALRHLLDANENK
jgi:hypothetical protein